jgi:hypothetical protein
VAALDTTMGRTFTAELDDPFATEIGRINAAL